MDPLFGWNEPYAAEPPETACEESGSFVRMPRTRNPRLTNEPIFQPVQKLPGPETRPLSRLPFYPGVATQVVGRCAECCGVIARLHKFQYPGRIRLMLPRTSLSLCHAVALLIAWPTVVLAQKPPYDVFPPAQPPYYRVRFEAATQADNTTQPENKTRPGKTTQPHNKTLPGGLIFPVNYTIWIPENVKRLRGVIVHQHGCGEGFCKSGLTGAYDLHWQALAKKHNCALLAPSYEQPEKADCQMWCDPRNGSAEAFQQGLVELGKISAHPELAEVPWALWGHSGGGHWAGGMVLLYPERVAAAWLRSGVPLLEPNPLDPNPGRPPIKAHAFKAHTLPAAALQVPIMCNLGTKEGVTTKGGPFASVWTANEAFFKAVRKRGGLVGVAIDPLTAHECGNRRYLAIPWLDACLSLRLPKVSGQPLQPMPADAAWLAEPTGARAASAAKFAGDALQAAWLPNAAIARAWMQYVKDTAVTDTTPPPAPDQPARHRQRLELASGSRSRKRTRSFHDRTRRRVSGPRSPAEQEPLRPPPVSEPAVQRHTHPTARAPAIHRHQGRARSSTHLPRDRGQHSRPAVKAKCRLRRCGR